jgi:hypothetical protein
MLLAPAAPASSLQTEEGRRAVPIIGGDAPKILTVDDLASNRHLLIQRRRSLHFESHHFYTSLSLS